jgi:DnaJ-class molecular chaperone
MTTDWTLELTRTCHTCKGTGKFQSSPSRPPQATYTLGPNPLECQTCGGTGSERKAVTLEDLKGMLAL